MVGITRPKIVAITINRENMVQALLKPVTFEQFAQWYPDTGIHYELHNGIIVEINQPSGDHEMVIALLSRKLTIEVDKKNLPYVIPESAFVKLENTESAYCPDIVILNPLNLVNEPLWQKHSTLTQSALVPTGRQIMQTKQMIMKRWEYLNTGFWIIWDWVVEDLLVVLNSQPCPFIH